MKRTGEPIDPWVWFFRYAAMLITVAVIGAIVTMWIDAGRPASPWEWYACVAIHVIGVLFVGGTGALWRWLR